MDLKQLVMLALQLSILSTVFGFGLKATTADLLYLVRRPGLLVRSLLSMFVIIPVIAIALSRWFNFRPEVEIALIALAISPVPPLLPMKQTKAGGHGSYGLGLMAMLALLSIVLVPLALEILERLSGRPLAMAPGAVAKVVLMAVLLPLAAGMIVRALLPAVAVRLEKPVSLLAKVLLPLAVIALLVGTLPAVKAALGDGTVLALVAFVVVGLAVGHFLGRPDPDHSIVLALSTACRHPGIAFAIAAANFPDQRFGGVILLYLIVGAIAALPYLKWVTKRQVTEAPAAA